MERTQYNGTKYNRFVNLDGSEDRIIYWLLSPNNKNKQELEQTHIIWKLLMYNDCDALKRETPSYFDVIKLISNDDVLQADKRIFRHARLEDGFTEQCTILKVYVDSIIPQNAYTAQVNYGVDVICHNKIVNVSVAHEENEPPIDIVDNIPIYVETKSRITLMTRAVLSLLNGADIAGVGQLQFNMENFRYVQSQYSLWNNRNFEGIKNIVGCMQSGLF